MKVLHLPKTFGANSWALAQGEKALGLDSQVLSSRSEWLDYPADIHLHLEKVANGFAGLVKLTSTFLSIRKKYDIFHFNFGSSLIHFPTYGLNQAELPFYPKGKKLFVTYNGCDARQKYPTMARQKISACNHYDCYEGKCNSGKLDRLRREGIDKMAEYVRHIWAVNPDLMYFLPPEKSSFLPYSVTMDHLPVFRTDFSKNKLHILHAPTNRVAKGSVYILTALEHLRQVYPEQVDITLVEHIPHHKALEIYQKADLVIDQILIGWYGAFAVEVMCMGKPVICRIEKNDFHFLPKKMAGNIPDAFINADPDTIHDVLVRCVEDRQFLKRKSEAAIEYARTWHHPKHIASITKEAYETL